MKKTTVSAAFGLFGCAFLLCTVTGCAPFNIMPNHDPRAIQKYFKDRDAKKTPPPQLPDLKGKTIVLNLTSDHTTQPVGAYHDDILSGGINSVTLTYVIPKPGYVLFSRIAEAMKAQSAVVYRNYDTSLPRGLKLPKDTKVLNITVANVEFHYYRKKDETKWFIGRCWISYEVADLGQFKPFRASTDSGKRIDVMAMVKDDKDLFNALAEGVIARIGSDL